MGGKLGIMELWGHGGIDKGKGMTKRTQKKYKWNKN